MANMQSLLDASDPTRPGELTGSSEMARLKEQLFLARKDLVCAQILHERWKDTLV